MLCSSTEMKIKREKPATDRTAVPSVLHTHIKSEAGTKSSVQTQNVNMGRVVEHTNTFIVFEMEWSNPEGDRYSPTMFKLSEWNKELPDVFLQRHKGDYYLMMTHEPEQSFNTNVTTLMNICPGGGGASGPGPVQVTMCLRGTAPTSDSLIQHWRGTLTNGILAFQFQARMRPKPGIRSRMRADICVVPNPHRNDEPLEPKIF